MIARKRTPVALVEGPPQPQRRGRLGELADARDAAQAELDAAVARMAAADARRVEVAPLTNDLDPTRAAQALAEVRALADVRATIERQKTNAWQQRQAHEHSISEATAYRAVQLQTRDAAVAKLARFESLAAEGAELVTRVMDYAAKVRAVDFQCGQQIAQAGTPASLGAVVALVDRLRAQRDAAQTRLDALGDTGDDIEHEV